MGEPADEVVLEGGPYDGVAVPCEWPTLRIPAWMSSEDIARKIQWQAERGLLWEGLATERVGDHPPHTFRYADTGRRTPDGRRVFAPEAKP